MINFTLVSPECGDWEALYMNDKLITEGHSIRLEEAIKQINEEYAEDFEALKDYIRLGINSFEYKTIPDEVAEKGMPERLEELE